MMENALSDRALLEYLLNKIRTAHDYLLDDPPLSDEEREKVQKLADALGDYEPPAEPERVTEGTVDLGSLLKWLQAEAVAADLRAGFAPSRPGNALRSTADWIEIAYRPPSPAVATFEQAWDRFVEVDAHNPHGDYDKALAHMFWNIAKKAG